jgi:hypothetical protein
MKRVLVQLFFLQVIFGSASGQLVTYQAPDGSVRNTDFKIQVRQKGKEWREVAAYSAKVANTIGTKSVSENVSVAGFDFSGEVEVMVTSNREQVHQVRIRPLSYNIASRVTGNSVGFTLHNPCNVSVEINGDIFHNLHLFANPLEISKPNAADTNVIYFGPGIHQAGLVKVPSNKTVYIAGGAIVHGELLIDGVENVQVKGRGILTQQNNNKPATLSNNIRILSAQNIRVEGIIILPNKSSILMGESANVSIDNIKSFSAEGWGDGIDIFCSKHVLINGVFMRNSDDCIAIYGHRWSFYGNTTDILVRNATLWADIAHPVLIGTHGDSDHPDTLGGMRFSNIDILDHHENQIDYQGCLALNAGDDNLLRNIFFDSIRIDDFRKGQLVNIRVMFNKKYNTSAGRGVEDILFKNISYTGSRATMSVIAGYDEKSKVKNVVFENLCINGVVIADDMVGKPGFYKTGDMADIFTGEHVEGLKFIASPVPGK